MFDKIKEDYTSKFSKIAVKEKSILDTYSKLDRDKQSHTVAGQHKDMDYEILFNRRA